METINNIDELIEIITSGDIDIDDIAMIIDIINRNATSKQKQLIHKAMISTLRKNIWVNKGILKIQSLPLNVVRTLVSETVWVTWKDPGGSKEKILVLDLTNYDNRQNNNKKNI